MSIKLKVFASILAAIVIAIVCMGVVFALPNADFVIDGSISYEAPKSLYELSSDGYYYAEMGRLDDGTPIKWKLIGYDKGEGSGSARYTKFNPDNGIETDKGKGVFVQETLVGAAIVVSSPEGKAFFASTKDENLKNTYANDYATSDIRNYITSENGESDSLLKDYKIEESNEVYSQIVPRKLSDMYATAGAVCLSSINKLQVEPSDTPVSPSPDSAAPDPTTTQDKLWLLSVNEACFLFEDYEITGSGANKAGVWSSTYWLRSPNPSNASWACFIYYDGTADNGIIASLNVTEGRSVRAAFYLELK